MLTVRPFNFNELSSSSSSSSSSSGTIAGVLLGGARGGFGEADLVETGLELPWGFWTGTGAAGGDAGFDDGTASGTLSSRSPGRFEAFKCGTGPQYGRGSCIKLVGLVVVEGIDVVLWARSSTVLTET
jgi:hypothetical protein